MANGNLTVSVKVEVPRLRRLDHRLSDILVVLETVLETLARLELKGEEMTEAVARLSAAIDDIQGDITTIKTEKDATIAQLREDLAAALLAGDPAAVQAAIDAAVAAADQALNDSLEPVVAKAEALAAENPEAPPVEP